MRQGTQPFALTTMNWTYESADIREDIKGSIPPDTTLEAWKVKSGDSGQTYYIFIVKSSLNGMTKSWPFYYCNCPNNFPRAPLEMFHTAEYCKHITNLKVFLKEKGKL